MPLAPAQLAYARAQMDARHAEPVDLRTAACCPMCGRWVDGLWQKNPHTGECSCYACAPEDEKNRVAEKRAEALMKLGRMPRNL